MKVFIALAAFVVVASASGYGSGSGPAGYGATTLVPTGQSSQFRAEDNYGNFQFGYDESSNYGGSSRREEGGPGVRRGSYSLSDADGRRRTVNYVADHTGFHADVKTNEPGVEPRDPADVLINKDGYNVAAAPVAAPIAEGYGGPISTPVYSAPAYAAPEPAYGAAPSYGAGPAHAPTPRAFSYSFGSTHISPVAYAPAPVAYAPAPAAYAPAPVAAAPAYGPSY